jgi:hypothetical protein
VLSLSHVRRRATELGVAAQNAFSCLYRKIPPTLVFELILGLISQTDDHWTHPNFIVAASSLLHILKGESAPSPDAALLRAPGLLASVERYRNYTQPLVKDHAMALLTFLGSASPLTRSSHQTVSAGMAEVKSRTGSSLPEMAVRAAATMATTPKPSPASPNATQPMSVENLSKYVESSEIARELHKCGLLWTAGIVALEQGKPAAAAVKLLAEARLIDDLPCRFTHDHAK